MHHTKDKGDLAVFKVEADLSEKGWMILRPMTEHAPFDLVVYKDGIFKRVQVKYSPLRDGRIGARFSTHWADKNGTHSVRIDRTKVDVFALFCPETECCYYFDPKIFPKHHTVSFRVGKSKNNQKKNIRYARDYTVL